LHDLPPVLATQYDFINRIGKNIEVQKFYSTGCFYDLERVAMGNQSPHL